MLNNKTKKYMGWQYLGRAISLFLYVLGLISIFKPELISTKGIPWFVVLAFFLVATLGLLSSYFWECISVYDTYLIKHTGIDDFYEKKTKVMFKDILGIYGLKEGNEEIYIVASNIKHYFGICRSDIDDINRFERYLLTKSVSKEEFIKILKNQNKYKKGDEEYIMSRR